MVLFQTLCDEDKRSYASLARNGDLPFYARQGWNKKMHPMVATGKRYVGALAKSGGFPYGKRSDELEDEDLLRELLKDVEEKRSLASLARSGSLQGDIKDTFKKILQEKFQKQNKCPTGYRLYSNLMQTT